MAIRWSGEIAAMPTLDGVPGQAPAIRPLGTLLVPPEGLSIPESFSAEGSAPVRRYGTGNRLSASR